MDSSSSNSGDAERLANPLRDFASDPGSAEAALNASIASIEAQEHLPSKVRRQLITELEKQRAPLRDERLLTLLLSFGATLKRDFGIAAEFRVLKRRKRRRPSNGTESRLPGSAPTLAAGNGRPDGERGRA